MLMVLLISQVKGTVEQSTRHMFGLEFVLELEAPAPIYSYTMKCCNEDALKCMFSSYYAVYKCSFYK